MFIGEALLLPAVEQTCSTYPRGDGEMRILIRNSRMMHFYLTLRSWTVWPARLEVERMVVREGEIFPLGQRCSPSKPTRTEICSSG